MHNLQSSGFKCFIFTKINGWGFSMEPLFCLITIGTGMIYRVHKHIYKHRDKFGMHERLCISHSSFKPPVV